MSKQNEQSDSTADDVEDTASVIDVDAAMEIVDGPDDDQNDDSQNDDTAANDTTDTSDDDGEQVDDGTDVELATTTATPSIFSQLGEEFAGLDETAAIARLHQERAQAAQANQYQQMLQESQRQAAEAMAILRHQQEQQVLAQQQWQAEQERLAAEKTAWQAPEYNPAWNNQFYRDDNGKLQLIEGADKDLPGKIAKYAEWKLHNETEFWNNPQQFMLSQLQSALPALMDQHYEARRQAEQQQFSQQQYQQDLVGWEQEHAGLLYQDGKPTRYMELVATEAKQMANGGPVTTAHLDRALELWQYRAQKQLNQQQAAPAPAKATPAATNADKKTQLLKNGVTRKPNRSPARPETRATPPARFDIDALVAQDPVFAGMSD